MNNQLAGCNAGMPEGIVGHDTHARHHVLWNRAYRPLFLNEVFCMTEGTVNTLISSIRRHGEEGSVILNTDLLL
jgi:hypothetical protein